MPLTRQGAVGRSPAQWIREHRKLLAVLAVCETAALIMVSAIDPHAHIDGEVYQIGARAWLNGDPIYHDLPPTKSGLTLPFIYPPFAAIVFTPLAVVSKTVAVAMIMVVSHLCLLTTLYVVLRASPRLAPYRDRAVLLTAIVLPLATVTEPVKETITYAQINLVLMAMVAVDCLWRVGGERKLPYPRGLLIGLAIGLKLTPAVFLLFFLLRKDFRAIGTTVATFLVTVVIGLVFAFDAAKRFWLHEMLASSEVSFGPQFPGNASTYAGNQSIRGLLSRLQVPEPWLTVGYAALIVLALLLTLAGMLHALYPGRAGVRIRRTEGESSAVDLPTALGINAVLGLLVSPISWSHHWVWAVPVLLVLFGHAYRLRHWPLLLATAMVTEFFVLGPHWHVPQGNGKELTWTFFEHLIGNAYVYFGAAYLLYNAYLWSSGRRHGTSEVGTSRPAPV